MKQTFRAIITATLMIAGAAPVSAQQFPTVPDHTVIGRIGTGTGSGPSQAIPWTTLASNFLPTTVIYAKSYGVLANSSTDDSAAWATSIAAANNIGSNVTIIAPTGVSLAPSLAATISGTNIWIKCEGAPGTCVIKTGQSVPFTWSGTKGGTENMGFDNSGAATALEHLVTGSGQQFLNSVLSSGIGSFVQVGTSAKTGQNVTVLNVQSPNGVNNSGATPLFYAFNGSGFYVYNANVFPGVSFGNAAAGRNFIDIGGTLGTNFDTVIVQNSFPESFYNNVYALAPNASVLTDVYWIGNIADSTTSEPFHFETQSGGFLTNVHIQDNHITTSGTGGSPAVAAACISISGAGTNFGYVITNNNFPICGKQMISVSNGLSGSKILGNHGEAVSFSSTGTYDAIDLPSGMQDVQVIGNSTGPNTPAGLTSVPAIGLSIAGIGDHLTLAQNDFRGAATAAFNGMLAGTTTTYAHTNTKQRGNIGLQDSPVYAVNEGGTGAATLTGAVIGNGTSAFTGYAGASCANQAVTALSTSLGLTCASITNAYLAAGSFGNITGTGTLTSGTAGAGFTVGGVTMTLGSDAQGDVYYRNGSGVLTRLAPGTAGQSLKTGGVGANPSWGSSRQALTLNGAGGFAGGNTGFFVNQGSLTEVVAQTLVPTSGTFKNLYAQVSAAPAGTQTVTLTLRVNGADTAVTCTISATATTCNDTAHTASITAGQSWDVKVVYSATAASSVPIAAVEFDNP